MMMHQQQRRAYVPQIMPAYNLNSDFAYPMHTNLNLMNLKNKIDHVNVDSEANFVANTNGGQNMIKKLVGSQMSTINFDVAEATIDGEDVLVVIPKDQEVPTSKPTNYIQEFESDGTVNFSGAKNSGGALNKIDEVVGGANSKFTFSLLNLDAHVANFQTSG